MKVPDDAEVNQLETMMEASSGPRNPIAEAREFYSGANRRAQTRLPMKPHLLPGLDVAAPVAESGGKRGSLWAVGALVAGILLGYAVALVLGPLGGATVAPRGSKLGPTFDGFEGSHASNPLGIKDSVLESASRKLAPPLRNYASPANGGSVVPQLTHFERGWLDRLLGLDPPDMQELVAARATPLICVPVQSKGSLTVKLAVDVRVHRIVVRGQGRCGVRLPNMAESAERFMTPGPGGTSRAEFAVDSTIGILTVHLIGECCVDGVEVWGVYQEG